jgi:hypothetical protein
MVNIRYIAWVTTETPWELYKRTYDIWWHCNVMNKGHLLCTYIYTLDYLHTDLRWWAPWLSVRVFSHFCTVSGQSRDRITCHRHHTTYPDLYRSFLIVCDDFWSFPIIFSDLWWFLPSGDVLCSLQLPDQHHVTLRKLYSSVKQLPRTPALRYIKIARPRQRTASARWCEDSAWSHDQGYMPNIDMLNVGVHVRFRSLVLSGKT